MGLQTPSGLDVESVFIRRWMAEVVANFPRTRHYDFHLDWMNHAAKCRDYYRRALRAFNKAVRLRDRDYPTFDTMLCLRLAEGCRSLPPPQTLSEAFSRRHRSTPPSLYIDQLRNKGMPGMFKWRLPRRFLPGMQDKEVFYSQFWRSDDKEYARNIWILSRGCHKARKGLKGSHRSRRKKE